jgi:cytochrome c2
LKTTSLSLTLAALLVAAGSVAQTPQAGALASGAATTVPRAPRTYPAPTNLKVLPKEMTGQQVHEVMEKWESELGAHCNSCHTVDPNNIGPNGKPRLKFEDDAKDEKVVARMMYTMTQEMNRKYFGALPHDEAEGKAVSVTCSTCHRGQMHPEKFVPVKEGPKPPMPPMPGMQMPAQGQK